MNDFAVGEAYLRLAEAKTSMPFGRAFVSGILCNALVCLAVWMATAGRSVVDKTIAIVSPSRRSWRGGSRTAWRIST